MAFSMPATKSAPKTVEQLVPVGLHIGRCYGIVDLGSQKGSVQYPAPKRKILMLWELPELMKVFKEEKGEQPMVLKKKYTYAFSDKSILFKDLKSWFSDKPDGDMAHWLQDLSIGKASYLNVTQEVFEVAGEKINYNSISSISPLPPKTKCPTAINMPVLFDMFGVFDEEKFNALPEWIQKEIKKSPEYGRCIGASILGDGTMNKKDSVDDLPF